jgi:hypothetical protein
LAAAEQVAEEYLNAQQVLAARAEKRQIDMITDPGERNRRLKDLRARYPGAAQRQWYAQFGEQARHRRP